MGKQLLYRMLAFIVYSMALLPWIASILLNYYDMSWFVALVFWWLVTALTAQSIAIYLNRNSAWLRGLLILISLLSSGLLAYLLIPEGPLYLQIFLGVLTLGVWIAAFFVASVDLLLTFIEGKYLITGLVILSLHAFLFSSAPQLVYVCFTIYICCAAFLFMQIRRLNKLVSTLTLAFILLLAFSLAGLKDGVLTLVWWVYRYVIVNILLVLIAPFGFLAQLGVREGGSDEPRAEPEGIIVDPLDPPNELTDLKPGKPSSIDWIFIFKGIALLLLLAIAIFIVYKVIYKVMHRSKEEDVEEVHKEFVQPAFSLLPNFMKRGRAVLDSLKSTLLPTTLEGKVRKMYRQLVSRMIGQAYPMTHDKTPTEAGEMFVEQDRYIFRLYNQVRYGGKKVTPEQFSNAEESFQSLNKEVKQKDFSAH